MCLVDLNVAIQQSSERAINKRLFGYTREQILVVEALFPIRFALRGGVAVRSQFLTTASMGRLQTPSKTRTCWVLGDDDLSCLPLGRGICHCEVPSHHPHAV